MEPFRWDRLALELSSVGKDAEVKKMRIHHSILLHRIYLGQPSAYNEVVRKVPGASLTL